MKRLCCDFMVIVLVCAPPPVIAGQPPDTPELSRETKALLLNAAVGLGIVSWGLSAWDYGEYSFNTKSEGWFEKTTREGGADKAGHLYSSCLMASLFGALYKKWEFEAGNAARYGFWSAIAMSALMEFGDGFSHYGFSHEDMIANTLGAGLGYCFLRHPALREKVDFRIEYLPDPGDFNGGDPTTDYEHMKYLVAIKGSGFPPLSDTFLTYLEFQAGFYARGYDDYQPDGKDDRRQVAFLAIGVNVEKLLAPVWKTSLWRYLQAPFTYIPVKKEWKSDTVH